MKRASTLSVQSEKAPACADHSQGESQNESKKSEASGGATVVATMPAGEEASGVRGKFCSKKRMEMRPLSKRERRERAEQQREHKALLEEFGVSEGDLRRWRRHALAARRLERNGPVRLKRYGREAVVEEAGEFEHCRDLAGSHARESAARKGDATGNVRDRYELIVAELLAARYVQRDGGRYSLSRVLLCECGTDKALEEFLQHLGRWIKRFALRYYIYGLPHNTWVMPGSDVRAIKTLRGRSVSENMIHR
jgi:hypothetical protein